MKFNSNYFKFVENFQKENKKMKKQEETTDLLKRKC